MQAFVDFSYQAVEDSVLKAIIWTSISPAVLGTEGIV